MHYVKIPKSNCHNQHMYLCDAEGNPLFKYEEEKINFQTTNKSSRYYCSLKDSDKNEIDDLWRENIEINKRIDRLEMIINQNDKNDNEDEDDDDDKDHSNNTLLCLKQPKTTNLYNCKSKILYDRFSAKISKQRISSYNVNYLIGWDILKNSKYIINISNLFKFCQSNTFEIKVKILFSLFTVKKETKIILELCKQSYNDRNDCFSLIDKNEIQINPDYNEKVLLSLKTLFSSNIGDCIFLNVVQNSGIVIEIDQCFVDIIS